MKETSITSPEVITGSSQSIYNGVEIKFDGELMNLTNMWRAWQVEGSVEVFQTPFEEMVDPQLAVERGMDRAKATYIKWFGLTELQAESGFQNLISIRNLSKICIS